MYRTVRTGTVIKKTSEVLYKYVRTSVNDGWMDPSISSEAKRSVRSAEGLGGLFFASTYVWFGLEPDPNLDIIFLAYSIVRIMDRNHFIIGLLFCSLCVIT